MKRYLKRFAGTEQKTNQKKAFFYLFLTVVTVIVLYFLGIPALSKLTTLVSSFKNSNSKIDSSDITPPPPPKFKSFSEFTNQKETTLSGTAESGSTVKITFNGIDQEMLSDGNGQFSFNISLENGVNTFAAIAIDQSGNQSQKTNDYQITFDNKMPDMEIVSPNDGSSFFGSTQRQVTIEGTTEVEASVTINGRIISVEDDGSFQYTTTLSDGSNTFNIKAFDQAGNLTEKNIVFNFSP